MNKKIYLVSVLFLALMLASCTKNGSNEQNKNEMQENVNNENTGQFNGTGNGQGQGMRGNLDMAAAAEKLGISEDELTEAMKTTDDDGRPSMEAAAEELGITVEELREALGMPEGMPKNGGPMGGREASGSGRPKMEE